MRKEGGRGVTARVVGLRVVWRVAYHPGDFHAGGLRASDCSLQLRVCYANPAAALSSRVSVSLTQATAGAPGATTTWVLSVPNGWCQTVSLAAAGSGALSVAATLLGSEIAVGSPVAVPSVCASGPSPPTISPLGGYVLGPVLVTLASSPAGAAVSYSLSGAATAQLAAYTGPFLLYAPGNTTVFAQRCARGAGGGAGAASEPTGR